MRPRTCLATALIAAALSNGAEARAAEPPDLDAFAEGAAELTNLTEAQAEQIFLADGALAAQLPVSVLDEGTITATRSGCTVTTTRKVRNNLGMVMFSFTMRQYWEYDGWRVYPHAPRISWNITAWGAAWAWNGLTEPSDGWYWTSGSGSAYEVHTSRRTGSFVIQGPWPVYNNPRRMIEKWHNGDWRTSSDVGLPGCKDDD